MNPNISIPISVITAIVVAIIIILAAFKTNILRESDSTTAPYSLSKFQLWLWTLAICPLFALHWGRHNGHAGEELINYTSIILLGIASAVTLTSGVITQLNLNSEDAKKRNKSRLTAVAQKVEGNSRGFWIDLLTGNDEKSPIERLQNLVFTFIFVIMYLTFFFSENLGICKVIPPINSWNYMDFKKDDIAYILMGISSGSYLIGKSMNR